MVVKAVSESGSRLARVRRTPLDLTNPEIADAWGYEGGPITSETQGIGAKAADAGYNAIRFWSEQGEGANYAILGDFGQLLSPQMINSRTVKVSMRLFEYTCGRCGNTYQARQPPSTYGTLVFRDESGKYAAAVDAIGDELFARVGTALARHPASKSINDRRRDQVVQQVVGRLSDRAPGGTIYDPDAKPASNTAAQADRHLGGRSSRRTLSK